MKIKLAGQEIEIKLTHKRIQEIEKVTTSIYSYVDKCVDKSVTVSEIVVMYYQGQEGTAYSEDQIFEKIIQDGLSIHVSNTINIVMELIVGKENFSKIEKQIKNQEDSPVKKN